MLPAALNTFFCVKILPFSCPGDTAYCSCDSDAFSLLELAPTSPGIRGEVGSRLIYSLINISQCTHHRRYSDNAGAVQRNMLDFMLGRRGSAAGRRILSFWRCGRFSPASLKDCV